MDVWQLTASKGKPLQVELRASALGSPLDGVATVQDEAGKVLLRVQGDKAGTFVLQGLGEFDGKEARTRLAVVPGSSTGDLAGLRGSGLAVAPMGSTGTFSLDYDL